MATNENRLTLQDKLALVTAILLILSTVAGFVSYLVSGTETRVLRAIETVDSKIEKVDSKLDKHIDFHLTNKLQCKEDVTNAEEEDTEETSASERVEVAWRGERKRTEGKTIRKQN
jgi:hypothetical protein